MLDEEIATIAGLPVGWPEFLPERTWSHTPANNSSTSLYLPVIILVVAGEFQIALHSQTRDKQACQDWLFSPMQHIARQGMDVNAIERAKDDGLSLSGYFRSKMGDTHNRNQFQFYF